jgi:hypothetical protein
MATAAISCLFLLILGGMAAEGKSDGPILPDMAGGRLINFCELQFTDNVTLQYWYPWNETTQATSKIALDPHRRYMIMVVEL